MRKKAPMDFVPSLDIMKRMDLMIAYKAAWANRSTADAVIALIKVVTVVVMITMARATTLSK